MPVTAQALMASSGPAVMPTNAGPVVMPAGPYLTPAPRSLLSPNLGLAMVRCFTYFSNIFLSISILKRLAYVTLGDFVISAIFVKIALSIYV